MLDQTSEAIAKLAQKTREQAEQTRLLVDRTTRILEQWRCHLAVIREECARHQKWITGTLDTPQPPSDTVL